MRAGIISSGGGALGTIRTLETVKTFKTFKTLMNEKGVKPLASLLFRDWIFSLLRYYFTSSNPTIYDYQHFIVEWYKYGYQVHRNDIGYFVVLSRILFLPIPF